MKRELLYINSNCDNLPLSVAVFEPDGEAKGVVQFAHGMAEHKERYFGFMEYLAEAGYASVINDHRGHGYSVKSRDDLGYFYDDTTTYITKDVHQVTEYIKERIPGVPVYLFGHSMGSIVAREYLKLYDKDIDKLVLCGAPGSNPVAGVAKLLIKLQTKKHGDRYRSPLMYNLSVGGYSKAIPGAETECDWLSVNKENVEAYLKDPLCGFKFTLNGYKNLIGILAAIFDNYGWKVANKNLPIHFIAGSDDPVIGKESQWLASQNFLLKQGYSNVTGKLYNGMRHEILLETDKELVYKDVLEFLEK